MSKEYFIRAHEQLIEKYLEAHPDADWSEAYEKTQDNIQERLEDNIAAMADAAKEKMKYGNS
jgi:hypothetical protein